MKHESETPPGMLLVFHERGKFLLKQFDGSVWYVLRELTEKEVNEKAY